MYKRQSLRKPVAAVRDNVNILFHFSPLTSFLPTGTATLTCFSLSETYFEILRPASSQGISKIYGRRAWSEETDRTRSLNLRESHETVSATQQRLREGGRHH